jgi:mRNA interferase MazF
MSRKKSNGVRNAAMRHGDVAAYCPDAGDIIWLDFLQPVANEQAGRRPALVLSPQVFNELTGRCIACPITRRDRDWSFQVAIPAGHEITGVVQADQLRSASWEQRGSRFICKAPTDLLNEVRARLKPLLLL